MDCIAQFGHVNHECRKSVQFYLCERLHRFLAPFIPKGHITYSMHLYWVKTGSQITFGHLHMLLPTLTVQSSAPLPSKFS